MVTVGEKRSRISGKGGEEGFWKKVRGTSHQELEKRREVKMKASCSKRSSSTRKEKKGGVHAATRPCINYRLLWGWHRCGEVGGMFAESTENRSVPGEMR